MSRHFNARAAGWVALAIFMMWVLNYSYALNRYDDQIAACAYGQHNRDTPLVQFVTTARDRTREQAKKDPAQTPYADIYEAIREQWQHSLLDTPCRDHYTKPGFFG